MRFGEAGVTIGNGKKIREILAVGLRIQRDRLIVELDDQREVSIPLNRYPTLLKSPRSQRADWQLIGPGKAFHWPALDLDISVAGLVSGLPEIIPAPPRRLKPQRSHPSLRTTPS